MKKYRKESISFRENCSVVAGRNSRAIERRFALLRILSYHSSAKYLKCLNKACLLYRRNLFLRKVLLALSWLFYLNEHRVSRVMWINIFARKIGIVSFFFYFKENESFTSARLISIPFCVQLFPTNFQILDGILKMFSRLNPIFISNRPF